jgi:hypothetical protein
MRASMLRLQAQELEKAQTIQAEADRTFRVTVKERQWQIERVFFGETDYAAFEEGYDAYRWLDEMVVTVAEVAVRYIVGKLRAPVTIIVASEEIANPVARGIYIAARMCIAANSVGDTLVMASDLEWLIYATTGDPAYGDLARSLQELAERSPKKMLGHALEPIVEAIGEQLGWEPPLTPPHLLEMSRDEFTSAEFIKTQGKLIALAEMKGMAIASVAIAATKIADAAADRIGKKRCETRFRRKMIEECRSDIFDLLAEEMPLARPAIHAIKRAFAQRDENRK